MLLEADWIAPISSPPVVAGGVLVRDGSIEAVGPAAELRARHPEEPGRVFPGCVLMPGLVNTHTHLEYSAFRGFCGPCGFGEWMLHLLLARRKLTPEDYAVSASWGAYECVRSGVTCIADTSFEGWTTARAAGMAGLRARVYLEVFGFDDAGLPRTMERLEDRVASTAAARARSAERGSASVEVPSLLEVGVSPHAPYSVSARLYREAARFARRSGLRLATHLAESPAEVEFFARGTGAIANAYRAAHLWKGRRWTVPGKSPVQHVADTGALGPSMLAVHCVQIDEDDIATLAHSGTAVSHCPRSNRTLRCGVAPVAELLTAGVIVGLGTDSLGSNEDLDLFREMRAAADADRARAAEAGVRKSGTGGLPHDGLLRMATLEGARALGWDHIVGSLDPGKRADLIAVRLPAREEMEESARPGLDPVEALVSYASAADVTMVMVDGRTILDRASTPGSGTLRDRTAAPRGGTAESAPNLPGDLVAAFSGVRAKLNL